MTQFLRYMYDFWLLLWLLKIYTHAFEDSGAHSERRTVHYHVALSYIQLILIIIRQAILKIMKMCM